MLHTTQGLEFLTCAEKEVEIKDRFLSDSDSNNTVIHSDSSKLSVMMLYLARYTLLRHSCFIFLYCDDFECTNCFEYGQAASLDDNTDEGNEARNPVRWV